MSSSSKHSTWPQRDHNKQQAVISISYIVVRIVLVTAIIFIYGLMMIWSLDQANARRKVII